VSSFFQNVFLYLLKPFQHDKAICPSKKQILIIREAYINMRFIIWGDYLKIFLFLYYLAKKLKMNLIFKNDLAVS